MKILKFFILICVSLFSTSFTEEKSEDLQISPKMQKIYLNSNAIILSNDKIEVELEGNIISISCLFVDEGGFFTFSPKFNAWKCRCGATNPEYANICWKCHDPK